MNAELEQAVAGIEALFDEVVVDPKALDTTIVCSGACGLPGEPVPVLCANEGLAIHFFKQLMSGLIATTHKGRRKLIWRNRPVMQAYQMTMAGLTDVHRVVSNRYSVYAVCAFADSDKPPVDESQHAATSA